MSHSCVRAWTSSRIITYSRLVDLQIFFLQIQFVLKITHASCCETIRCLKQNFKYSTIQFVGLKSVKSYVDVCEEDHSAIKYNVGTNNCLDQYT